MPETTTFNLHITADELAPLAAKELESVYADRNRLVLLAYRLAAEAGYEVGLIEDASEPMWPVLAITLSEGVQVSWHVPEQLIRRCQQDMPRAVWDGHTNEEKARRIMAFWATT